LLSATANHGTIEPMAKLTDIDKQWQELMSLCDMERKFGGGRHPKLLRLVSRRIDDLARTMGFRPRQIETREFRAVRNGEHIVKIINDG
jgi:hypothetical protein